MGKIQKKIKKKIISNIKKEAQINWDTALIYQIHKTCLELHQEKIKKTNEPVVEFAITLKNNLYFCKECFLKYQNDLENNLKDLPFCYFCTKITLENYNNILEKNILVKACKKCFIEKH